VRQGWYQTLTVVGVSLASVVLSIFVSLKSAERAIAADRAAQAKAAAIAQAEALRTREAARQSTCLVVTAQEEVSQEFTSAAGRKAATAWRALREQFQCD
jgi:hypothetical protein